MHDDGGRPVSEHQKTSQTTPLGMAVPEGGTPAATNTAVSGFCGPQKIGNFTVDLLLSELTIPMIVVRPNPKASPSSRRSNRSAEMASPMSSAVAT